MYKQKLEKMEDSYDDTVDFVYGYYKIAKPKNIEKFNNTLIDEEFHDFYINYVEELQTVMAMCYSMTKLEMYDKHYFNVYKILVSPYKEGKYDNYLFNKVEDKKLMDEHIKIIEEYIKNTD